MSAYVVCTRACVYVPLCRWDEYRACSSPRVSSVTRLLWHLRLLLLLALDVVAVILCVRWEHRAAVETIWVNNHMAHYVGLATDLVGNTSASSASSSCTWPLLAAGGHRVSPTDDGATILLASFDFVFVTEVLDLSMDAFLCQSQQQRHIPVCGASMMDDNTNSSSSSSNNAKIGTTVGIEQCGEFAPLHLSCGPSKARRVVAAANLLQVQQQDRGGQAGDSGIVALVAGLEETTSACDSGATNCDEYGAPRRVRINAAASSVESRASSTTQTHSWAVANDSTQALFRQHNCT